MSHWRGGISGLGRHVVHQIWSGVLKIWSGLPCHKAYALKWGLFCKRPIAARRNVSKDEGVGGFGGLGAGRAVGSATGTALLNSPF